MRIFIHNDDNQLVATYDGKSLYGSPGAIDPQLLAFYLWTLSIKLMGVGSGSGGFGYGTNPLTDHAIDGGEPSQ